MPIILMKNNIKLMLRSKAIMLIIIICPVLVIAVLSSVFEEMMKSFDMEDGFTVGYRVSEESIFFEHKEAIQAGAEEADMSFIEYPTGDVMDICAKNNCGIFVEFEKDSYRIYCTKEYETEGTMVEYFLNRMMNGLMSGMQGTVLQGTELQGTKSGDGKVQIPIESLEAMPNVDSKNYYGIIYIVYFVGCCFITLASVFSSERKHKIGARYGVSPVSNLGFYLAKVLPCILVTVIGIGISTLLSTFSFGIKWGNYPMTILIMTLFIIASSAFGLLLCLLFRNLAISISLLFASTWVAGFVGGSFETYMFSKVDESIKLLSPIYHVNRTLVEYSAMGYSDYAKGCIVYLLLMTVGCAILGVLVSNLNRGK